MFAALIDQEAVGRESPRPNQAGSPVLACTPAEGRISGELDEMETIRAAQAGDLSAFNHLVGVHQDSIYGWVLSLVNDSDLAEDITQATFITAYEKLSIFRGGSLRAWLFTIARNRSFDELRRQKRRPILSLDNSPDSEEERDLLSFLPGQDLRPEDIYEANEQAIAIDRMIARLPATFQEVIRLVDLEEMDYNEAASVLGLPMGTLKSRLARARLKMREMLLQSGYLS